MKFLQHHNVHESLLIRRVELGQPNAVLHIIIIKIDLYDFLLLILQHISDLINLPVFLFLDVGYFRLSRHVIATGHVECSGDDGRNDNSE
jgi:hypothetical protein